MIGLTACGKSGGGALDAQSTCPPSVAHPHSAPIVFHDNASLDRAKFISPQEVANSLNLGTSNIAIRTQANGEALMPWCKVQPKNSWLASVDPNRQVYEITATYDSPFTVHGNLYSSGTRTIVVDAQTGFPFFGMAKGRLIRESMVHVRWPSPRASHIP